MSNTRLGDLTRQARGAAGRAPNSKWVDTLARLGLAAKGVSFGIVGVLALKLALGSGGKASSREGALASLAEQSFGKVLLVLIAIGFAGYALWRFVQSFFDREHEGDGAKGLAKRAAYFGRGVIYAGLTFSAIKILTGSGGGGSQNAKAHRATAHVLSWPAGTWLVGIAGLCIVGVGLWNGYRGVTRKFLEHWKAGEMSAAERKWGARIGTVGLLARMVVYGLIGVFVVKAALDYEPKTAIGLDGALQKLASQSYGSWLLGLVAVGLLAYAVFGLVEARYRDV